MSLQNSASAPVSARMDHPDSPDVPARGDVIVRREDWPLTGQYSLREHPAAPQIRCGSRESALQIGRGFARARGVALWDDDGSRVTRLSGTAPRALPTD